VRVWVKVRVRVGATVAVAVRVTDGERTSVAVRVGVGVRVGGGVGVGPPSVLSQNDTTTSPVGTASRMGTVNASAAPSRPPSGAVSATHWKGAPVMVTWQGAMPQVSPAPIVEPGLALASTMREEI
jgi:hypothetical protein